MYPAGSQKIPRLLHHCPQARLVLDARGDAPYLRGYDRVAAGSGLGRLPLSVLGVLLARSTRPGCPARPPPLALRDRTPPDCIEARPSSCPLARGITALMSERGHGTTERGA